MKRIVMTATEAEVPEALEDGDLVEVVEFGGPMDGDVGYFRVRLVDDGREVELQPVEDEAGAA